MLHRSVAAGVRPASFARSIVRVSQIPKSSGRSLSTRCAAMSDGPLVSVEWLQSRLGQPGLVVLDAAWYLPPMGRDALGEYKAERVPGSLFFDIDGIADHSSDLPHMLPSEQAFACAMDALGIANDTMVVLYDHMGIFSAPRAWWTFRVFGHDKVAVLEGGLPAWKAAACPVDTDAVAEQKIHAAAQAAKQPGAAKYTAKLDKSKVRSLSDMLANVSSQAEQVMDARSPGRFVGTEPEPRAGLRGGHIPGAKNVPFPMVLDSGKYKSSEALQAVFTAAGLDLSKPLVGSCGSGLTACILALAVNKTNGSLVSIYDGSWSEWGACQDTPVATTEP